MSFRGHSAVDSNDTTIHKVAAASPTSALRVVFFEHDGKKQR
jgi:hypothetical protein